MRFAYDRSGVPSQISGGPGWLDTARYDIDASVEPSDGDDESSQVQLQARVRSLLAERFHLRARLTTQPVYILESSADAPVRSKKPAAKGISLLSRRGDLIVGQHASSASLAEALSSHLASQVLDHTGGDASYDFKMKWPPRDQVGALGNQLHEQLGLTLRSFPLELLEIESAEQPAE